MAAMKDTTTPTMAATFFRPLEILTHGTRAANITAALGHIAFCDQHWEIVPQQDRYHLLCLVEILGSLGFPLKLAW